METGAATSRMPWLWRLVYCRNFGKPDIIGKDTKRKTEWSRGRLWKCTGIGREEPGKSTLMSIVPRSSCVMKSNACRLLVKNREKGSP